MIWLLRWVSTPLLIVLFLVSKPCFEQCMLWLGWPHTDIVKEGKGLYLRRFYLGPPTWTPRVYLHHILRSDDDRDPHDHPWDYTTAILANGYRESVFFPRTPYGYAHTMTVGDFRRYYARHTHKLELLDGRDTWTLVIAGPTIRRWGFWILGDGITPRNDRWVDHVEYGAQGDKHDYVGSAKEAA